MRTTCRERDGQRRGRYQEQGCTRRHRGSTDSTRSELSLKSAVSPSVCKQESGYPWLSLAAPWTWGPLMHRTTTSPVVCVIAVVAVLTMCHR